MNGCVTKAARELEIRLAKGRRFGYQWFYGWAIKKNLRTGESKSKTFRNLMFL